MSTSTLQPTLRDVGIAAGFALALVLVAVVGYAPHAASAASQPVTATYDPAGFLPSAPLYATRSYDLTLDNLPSHGTGYGYGYGGYGYGSGATYLLRDPAGAPFATSTEVSADPEHPGKERVRFAGVSFPVDGTWTAEGGAMAATPLVVQAPPPAVAVTATYRGDAAPFRLSQPLETWVAYDLTFTGLPPGGSGYGYGYGYGGPLPYQLRDPDGAEYGAPQEGSGGNVTFASVLFPKEGKWSLRVGASWVPFHVGAAPVATFEAPRATALPLLTTTAPVAARHLDDFGRATVTLAFDPSLVSIVSVANGNVPASSLAWSVTGSVLSLTVETTRADVAGDFTLASITFRSGARLGAAPLDLTVVEHEKADGSPADARDVDGLYRSGALGIP